MARFLTDLLSSIKSRVFIIVLGILKVIIIARYLGPELNGTITGLLIYPSLFMSFGALGLRKSSAYFIGRKEYGEDEIKAAIVQIWLMMSAVSVLICFLLMRYFSSSGGNILHVFLALIPVPFSLLVNYISGIYLGRNEIKGFNKINWYPALFTLVGTVLFVLIFPMSVKGALIAEAAGPMIMCLLLLSKQNILKYLKYKVNFQITRTLLSLGIIYATSLLILNLNYRIDTVILDQVSTAYELGIYSKGSVMIQYLWQIPMLLGTIVFARSASAKDNHLFSLKVCKLMRLSFIIIGIGCIVLALLSKVIVYVLFGPAFAPSASVMALLAPGVLNMTVFKVLNMDTSGRGKPWMGVKPMIPALLINIVLNYLFIPKYGANAAAINSTISYTIGSVYFLFDYSKFTGIPIKTIFAFSRKDFDVFDSLIDKIRKKVPA